MEIELTLRGIPYESQKCLRLYYKEHLLKKEYAPDFLCYQQLVVELKALEKLPGNDDAQILNYLKATRMRVGLLLNFGSARKLEWKRIVH
jgi:GxxExxY protein